MKLTFGDFFFSMRPRLVSNNSMLWDEWLQDPQAWEVLDSTFTWMLHNPLECLEHVVILSNDDMQQFISKPVDR